MPNPNFVYPACGCKECRGEKFGRDGSCRAGYARCPDCGIKTVKDHEDLTAEEMVCDRCYYIRYLEDAQEN